MEDEKDFEFIKSQLQLKHLLDTKPVKIPVIDSFLNLEKMKCEEGTLVYTRDKGLVVFIGSKFQTVV